FNVQLKEAENALLRTKQDEAEKALLRVKQDEAESRKIVLLLSLLLIGGVALYLRKRASADRAEAAYHKARAAAESAANQAKSAFLANISHELRSPLNAILGFTRLVARESGLSDAARNDLRIVLKSSEHLYSLINQVLELSKIEAGHVVLNESTVDLYGLLEELEEMFSLSAQQKGLQFLVDSGSGLPRYIRTDAGKLRQVLINLLNNAIKFTGGGEVALRARTSPEGGRLHFAINDTGPGISADEIGKLGEVFVQAAAGRLAKEGTGLGLSITRRFVKLMGGQLRISSELGHGATFAFDIALDEISEASVVPEVDTASRKVIALTPGQPRYRILAVDDREEGRQLLTRLLAPLDFEVREASNGQEAVEIWEKWEPHLICMDIRMPVMDGREATRRIKATEKGKATVIVALTASSFDEERESILADGCDDFVRKPFHEHVLFDTLRKRLGVEFVYEDDMDRSTAALSDAARLAVLPVALRRRLATSLAGLDVAAIAGAIAAIREHDGGLADALDAQTANFDYAHLRALLAVADR
ncbi:MAG: ATP-binding protein, partial [Noviherbaspirillum sp.]